MKKFLEDLKRELKKVGIKHSEIIEIIDDHKEMIEEALNQGLTEAEINEKFGDPKNLAKDIEINQTKEEESFMDKEIPKEFKLHDKFEVNNDLKNIDISLISEDLSFEVTSGSEIEVYYKNVNNLDKFTVKFENGKFTLKRDKSSKLFFNTNRSADLLLKVPRASLEDCEIKTISGEIDLVEITTQVLKIKSTSGDIEIQNVHTKELAVTTVSGSVEVVSCEAKNVDLSSVSGDYDIDRLSCEEDLSINSVSGDFEIENTSADNAVVKTVSGDIDGKEFYPSTLSLSSVSGDITIDNSDKLKVIDIKKKKTLSGDIKIK